MLKVGLSKLSLPWSSSSTTPKAAANHGDKRGDSAAAADSKAASTTSTDSAPKDPPPAATPRAQLEPSASRRYYSHGASGGGGGGGRSGGTANGGASHPTGTTGQFSDSDEARDAMSTAAGKGANHHQRQSSNTSIGTARTPRGGSKHSAADFADFTAAGGAGGRALPGSGVGAGTSGASAPKGGGGGGGGGSGFGLLVNQRTARVVSADEDACWAVGMAREELARATLFDLAEKLNADEWARAVEGMSAKDRPRVIIRFRLVQSSNHRGGGGGGGGALSGRRVDCELQELVPSAKAVRVHIAPIPPNSPGGGGGGGGGGERAVAPTTPRAALSHSSTLSRAQTMSSQQQSPHAPSLSHSHTLAHSPSNASATAAAMLGGKHGAPRVSFAVDHGGRGGGGSEAGEHGGQARERERGRRGAAEGGGAREAPHGGKLGGVGSASMRLRGEGERGEKGGREERGGREELGKEQEQAEAEPRV
ncbi:hypothetical protein CLOM_g5978 [Closterium sp. NIES-68]|nr:hypothetical protein CLOM_g5978 [Closterium sp. NIES-68]